MKKYTIAALAGVVGLMSGVSATAHTMTKHDYKTGMQHINAEYKSDAKNCQSMSGNANDICMAEANGKEKVAKADLDARKTNTKKAYYDARIARADADYSVAKEKCDNKAGNDKDVCLKEAKAAEITAKSDAEAQMKTSKAYGEANETSAEARKEAKGKSSDAQHDAAVDKRAAEFSVAKEKCESLAGSTKQNCVDNAKMHYGKM